MRTSPSIRRRRTSRPCTASSTRSRRLRGWEPFVDRLLRTERCQVHLTGSSAQLLSWEIFPFSFREYLDYRGIDGAGELSTKRRLTIVKAFDEYWERGGFPEVAGLGRDLRIRIHQEYFNTILFRDLVERHDVSHPRAVSDLAHRLVDDAASLYTVNSLTGYLKSLGHKVPKASVSEYLEWFEDAYFPVHRAHLRRVGGAQERQSEEGVLHRSRPDRLGGIGDSGQLRPPAGEPGVHGAAAQASGDPLLPDANRGVRSTSWSRAGAGSRCWCRHASPWPIRGRGSGRPPRSSRRWPSWTSAPSTIVTRNERERIEAGGAAIEVVPAWRFLLDTDPAGD